MGEHAPRLRILLLADSYPPVLNSCARLFAELASSLKERGNDVRVLTLIPDRYLVRTDLSRLPRVFSRSVEDGIEVWRLRRPPLPRRIPALRGLEQVLTAIAFGSAGALMSRRNAVIAYSPPLPAAIAGYALARLWRGRAIVNVQDLYPETAMALGAMKNPMAIRVFDAAARFLYRHADAITVHSEGNRRHVANRGAGPRARIVPNWVDLSIRPTGGDEFRKTLGLGEEFVISYAGTMGPGQGLDDVIDAATALREYRSIAFVLAGDGSMRPTVEQQVRTRGLTNVRLLHTLGADTYQALLDASDACLVTLNKDLRTPVVPGKLASVLAAGKAAVCSVPLESDVWRVVEDAGAGVCVPAGRGGDLGRSIEELSRDRKATREMGGRGRAYAEKELDRARCVAIYFDLLEVESK